MTCTEFSHDGKYIATADMGGLVQVWLTSSGEKVWSFETEDIEVSLIRIHLYIHAGNGVHMNFMHNIFTQITI